VKKLVSVLLASLALASAPSFADRPEQSLSFTRLWTYAHEAGRLAEIPAFDKRTNTLWVASVVGVDVLDAENGTLIQHIDTSSYGSINSVAVHNGLAAFAIEATVRTSPGVVVFYDTRTRQPASGNNVVTVGALPDMLTFTEDGKKLLVANEGTPSTYGPRIGSTAPRVYGPASGDPAGSVSIIDMATRAVIAQPGFEGVPIVGSNVRLGTGMDFEPEYIAVNEDGTKAFVTLQEANAVAILDLEQNRFTKIVGLGAKDFGLAGNSIDPLNDGTVSFAPVNAKGLYMPDGIAAYKWRGRTYLVMANEGDFREDDGDRSAASTLGAAAPLNALRVSNTDTAQNGPFFAAGARSFSIRDEDGNLVYDSGDILDKEAHLRGVYDDGRSRDKGVEPEGVALLDIAGRTYAFVGLERTLKGTVAVFDITEPAKSRFLDMIVTDGDVAPEGLAAYQYRGDFYLGIANETSRTTTLYRIEREKKARDRR
jgi:DNA-binding beta-propeller fold protein YncE